MPSTKASPLLQIDDPGKRGARGLAPFALGFRPFYLLAAVLAVVAIPLWLGVFAGELAGPGNWPGLYWHAHETLFGFACAVIVGFLFTAVRNWTGLPTPSGWPLAALAGLWLAGRLACWAGPPALAAVVDLPFLLLAAGAIAQVLWRARNRRNAFVPVLLLALAASNALFHARAAGLLAGDPLQAATLALGLISVLTTVIAGRVVPMFTTNALRLAPIAARPGLDRAAITLSAAALLAWALAPGGGYAWLTAGLALAAALAQSLRTARWHPLAATRVPLLWILHLAHAWLIVGLLLAASEALGASPHSATVHALGLGAMSGLILGMITRTARGHTGRMLQAGRDETLAFTALQAGAAVRVLLPLAVPAWYDAALLVAGALWALAFALYLWRYTPWLLRTRVDGKPG